MAMGTISRRALLVMAALLCFAPLQAQKAAPVAVPVKTYTNPVWDRDFPDPFVLRYGGMFYAYATQNTDAGFQVMTSPDMVHWTHRGAAFKPSWAQAHYWAPEVVNYRGRFYMTYSALNPRTNKHDIGIAIANSPLGPFKEGSILVRGDNNRVGVIDSTIFFDVDKTPYLIYSEEDPRRIVLRKMAPDLLSVDSQVTELVHPDRPEESGVTEAPTLIRRRGAYFLIFSAGWFQGSKSGCRYAVYYAEAKSLRGPYVKNPKPLLQTVEGRVYGPGHQCVVTLPNGATWIVYHGWDNRAEPQYGSNPAGRTLRIDPLLWKNGEPYCEGPTTTPQPAPRLAVPK